MKKHNTKLQQLVGCKDCKKSCQWAGVVASENESSQKYSCNSSK